MGIQSTVVFADLFGSTGVFESFGNAKATEAVTGITNWLADKFIVSGGRVVKFLGDGVLVVFEKSTDAVGAVVDVQRAYQQRLSTTAVACYMPLRIGVSCGDVEMVDDDCYGDAVNVAARLSELAGPHQIWVNLAAMQDGPLMVDVRSRLLGPIHLRGRSEPITVYQVEWQEDVNSELLTIHAPMSADLNPTGHDALGGQVALTWLDKHKSFRAFELPVHIGRIHQAEFSVSDPRVSRMHARLDWRNGSVMLVDVSTYGCWVRFAGGGSDLQLRRDECVLHGHGEIALGTPFSDVSAPVLSFLVS
jgi:class 3 adenylate cyclase